MTTRVKTSGLARILTAFVTLLICSARAPAQSPGAGKTNSTDALLLTLEGKVEISRTASATWSAGETNQVLHVGDRLRTGIRSRATVRLSNLSVLRVNELTTLQIQPPSAPGKQAGLDLKSGAAYFLSRERPTETEFRTPLASGAIRGTEFHLAVADDGRSVVTLLDGAIMLSNEQGAVELASGEEATVEPGKAPTKTAALYALNTIQWCLYYPAVLDADEIGLGAGELTTLADSIAAYRSGGLLRALELFPGDRAPASDPGRAYYAALLLGVGQVAEAERQLGADPSRPAAVLRKLIATVKQQPFAGSSPASASEWLAESYQLQSQNHLEEARRAARTATEKSASFGFAWARLAELEFSFGRTAEALAALDKALQLSPRNAQAVALKGFLLAAQNKIPAAREQFENAIALDGALGNAWLGRGLIRIRSGDGDGGRRDLQVAATLEPQRALLRSYLGKAFANASDAARALKELALAQKLDPNDPTAWLYSALLKQQENHINDGVRELEKSQELNDNRRLYRSRLLLDQDRAVRSANLAQVYRDAGLDDWSVREAGRALNADYANYSAHLFLAESFDALRDPKQFNLRYETPWFSELLLSQLLSPVGAGNLSQYVSQQEYSKLFARDGLGLSSSTDYQSTGDWFERASQFGTFGDTSYALDFEHRSQTGERPNNDLFRRTVYAKFKHQFTPRDSVLFGLLFEETESGDVQQYYNPSNTSPALRVTERQAPNLFLGYHHEWSPGSHTLLLASRLDDTLELRDPGASLYFYRFGSFTRAPVSFFANTFSVTNRREFEAYSVELQHIFAAARNTFVVGARYQNGSVDSRARVDNPFNFPTLIAEQDLSGRLERFNIYGYDQFKVCDTLWLIGGVSYDWIEFPRNVDIAPLDADEISRALVSPKAGLIWSPWPDTHLRAAYTKSLGGLSYDNSVRIEPSQVAGFNQAFRSLVPEAEAGLVPGQRFETWNVALEHAFKRTGTYLSISAEQLESDATRTIGIITNLTFGVADSPSATRQAFDFREQTLAVTANQLLGRDWSFAARYAISQAELEGRFLEVAPAIPGAAAANQNTKGVLQQLTLAAFWNLPCGFFARGEAIRSQQDNRGDAASLADDDFWQFNLFAGYRFPHRKAELRLGLLNIGDQDYRLNPVNLYTELPRERTLSVLFKFYF